MIIEKKFDEQQVIVKGEDYEFSFYVRNKPEGKGLRFSLVFIGDESYRLSDGYIKKYGRGRAKHETRMLELLHEAKRLLSNDGYYFA